MMRDFRSVIVGALAILATTVVVKFSSIPTRVSVLESRFDSFDKKLDQILVHLK